MEALNKREAKISNKRIFEVFSAKDTKPVSEEEIIYPESDGKPMSDNTKQFRWIVKIKEGLEILFEDNPNVFVAGDLLWYPVKGDNKKRIAPDAMVAFGRPKGDRGSYLQWKEDEIAPQAVFEILSPGNRPKEMNRKFKFYEKYGVEEYYIYDPDRVELKGWTRTGNQLCPVKNTEGWISPILKIRFEIVDNELVVFRPDGRKFLSPQEIEHRAAKAEKLAEAERQKAQKLADKLREMGIDPDSL
ncbi:MAG: Uma2 family endonuclease [Desulfobacteraceae bacterium]|nr:Uma2 family endonuclease [Desulfobacteraceae bacterium]